MAGVSPFFVTGSQVKLQVNGNTFAFATDFSCMVDILTQTPKVLGMYEGVSVEPLGYSVSGSFTIVRYVKGAEANSPNNTPFGVAANDAGNGVGNWGSVWGGGTFSNIPALIGYGSDGRANEALDPSKYAQGTTFDIAVYQKSAGGDLGLIRVRNARISRMELNTNKKNATLQRFNFVGLYVDEDSFQANPSGLGQQNIMGS